MGSFKCSKPVKLFNLQVWFSVRNPTIACTPSEVSWIGRGRSFSWTMSTFYWEEQSYATQNLPMAWRYTLVKVFGFKLSKEPNFSLTGVVEWQKLHLSVLEPHWWTCSSRTFVFYSSKSAVVGHVHPCLMPKAGSIHKKDWKMVWT